MAALDQLAKSYHSMMPFIISQHVYNNSKFANNENIRAAVANKDVTVEQFRSILITEHFARMVEDLSFYAASLHKGVKWTRKTMCDRLRRSDLLGIFSDKNLYCEWKKRGMWRKRLLENGERIYEVRWWRNTVPATTFSVLFALMLDPYLIDYAYTTGYVSDPVTDKCIQKIPFHVIKEMVSHAEDLKRIDGLQKETILQKCFRVQTG